MLWAGLEYKLFNKGPVTSNVVEGGAFWYGDRSSPTPDLQFHFLVGAGVEAGIAPVPSGSGCTLNSYFLHPRSRGTVTLRSPDPADAPVIDPSYLSDPYDLKISVEGLKISREIMAQKPAAVISDASTCRVPRSALRHSARLTRANMDARPIIRWARAGWAWTMTRLSTRNCACAVSTGCASSTPRLCRR